MENLLNDARAEILSLRRKNEILSAKVQVMDLFAVVLHTAPAYPPSVMGLDVAAQLERAVEEMRVKAAVAKVATPENESAMPNCPCCGKNDQVIINRNVMRREQYFCPCNEPGLPYFDQP